MRLDRVQLRHFRNYENLDQEFDPCVNIIVGPNGGGKTTLLKAILGLIRPDKGTITFGEKMQGRKKAIGYLPQVRYIDKKFPITVLDVVLSGSIMMDRKIAQKVIREKAEAVAKVQVEMTILRAKVFATVVPSLTPEQRERIESNPMMLQMVLGGGMGGMRGGPAAAGQPGGRGGRGGPGGRGGGQQAPR